ncbi:xanthine phosphoribosyltransferase [Azotosporobacter soli]|uniref:xanthine phosphoribosyltransferase n=1 Tax=Azotosporobacter soli TaxID=3055040 RepID=UPI0031FE8A3F
MKLLKKKIMTDGKVVNDALLKVDSFLNHQIEPELMKEIGREFAERFKDAKVTKVLTIEASGIAAALMTALYLDVPLVFARKKKSAVTEENLYAAEVYSFTKKETNRVTVASEFLADGDQILIIDDFLANGEAVLGLCNIVEQAKANVVGVGIVIEKSFQPGCEKIRKAGYRLESLARIHSFSDGRVNFMQDDTK